MNYFRKLNKAVNEKMGQNMIELVVAIGIILMGVVSTLVLTLVTIRGGKSSSLQVNAVNLAREGIEVIKQKRDSNWLKIEANNLNATNWDDGLKDGNDYTAIVEFDPTTPPSWTIAYDKGISPITSCTNCRLYYHSTTGVYNHDSTNGQATVFRRLVQTNPICQDNDDKEEHIVTSSDCADDQTKIGIQVLSQVAWTEKNNQRSITLEDQLYNWRY